MDKKQQTIDTYNATAVQMAEKFSGIGARVADVSRAFSHVMKLSPLVVEIGCGNGRDAQEILKHTDRYIGMDISSEMIRIAQEALPEHAHSFVVADIESFDFPEGTDIVFSFASLLHTPKEELEKVLKKIFQALHPGGIAFISLKYADSYEEVTKTDEFGTRTYYYYTPEEILILGGSNFSWNEIDFQDLR